MTMIDMSHMTKNDTQKTNGVSNQAETGKPALNQDDFMKIFLAQMQLQDPMDPFDSNAMMQQMSQMTSLSATEELQKSITSLNASIGESEMLSASQLIGKNVQIASGASPLVEGKGLSGSVALPGPATDITVNIKDLNTGKVIKTINEGDVTGSGLVDFKWDGLDPNGEPMPEGLYAISGTAKINGKVAELPTAGTYQINSVTMDRNTNKVYMNLENGYGGVPMESVIKII